MDSRSSILFLVYSILLLRDVGRAAGGDGRTIKTTTRSIGCFRSRMNCELPAPAQPINTNLTRNDTTVIGNCELCLVVSNNRAITPNNARYCSEIITVLPFGASFCVPTMNDDDDDDTMSIGGGPINGGMFG